VYLTYITIKKFECERKYKANRVRDVKRSRKIHRMILKTASKDPNKLLFKFQLDLGEVIMGSYFP